MIRKFNSREEEIATILTEECAELIVECMKMKRKNEFTSEAFEEEVGDVLCLLELAREQGMYDPKKAEQRVEIKRNKLHKWSNLFN